MKLAEFLLNLTNLGVSVLVYSPGPGFWIICLRYEEYRIKTTLARHKLYDSNLSLDDVIAFAIKTCAEDLSNLLTVSKNPSNNAVGRNIKVLLSKED